MSDLEEAKLAVSAAKTTGLPVVASMVFDSGKNHDRTMMGNTPEQCAKALAESGADVIGSNCGQGIAGFLTICERLKSASQLPVWIKPNAGLPTVVGEKAQYATSAEEFASHVTELIRLGADFIGGCCGSNPVFIRAICRAR
jgi:5-methyltetrahydrofolate--homocysteine methyltransferase